MSARYVLISLALLFLGGDLAANAASKSNDSANQSSETRKATAQKRAGKAHSSKAKLGTGTHHIASRLIPPPPAYMPSILPEAYYYHGVTKQSDDNDDESDEIAAKPKNTYAKYFYSRDGEAPKGIQSRSGVTNWGTLR